MNCVVYFLLQAIDSKYTEIAAKVGPEQEVTFEYDNISLDIAAEGLKLQNGWTINPYTYPGVSLHYLTATAKIIFINSLFTQKIKKNHVDLLVPGRNLPSCQLHVKWTGQQPTELMHRIKLHGAKEPYNFFLIRLPAVQPQPSQGSIISVYYYNC